MLHLCLMFIEMCANIPNHLKRKKDRITRMRRPRGYKFTCNSITKLIEMKTPKIVFYQFFIFVFWEFMLFSLESIISCCGEFNICSMIFMRKVSNEVIKYLWENVEMGLLFSNYRKKRLLGKWTDYLSHGVEWISSAR